MGLAPRGASKVFPGGGAPEIRRSLDARECRDDEPSGSCSRARSKPPTTPIGAIEQEIELKSAELRKLNRIRRVCRDVRKRAETEAAIQALGEVIPFDADASKILEKAAKDEAAAAARIATLNEQIAALEAERAALIFDEALLARAEDIAAAP